MPFQQIERSWLKTLANEFSQEYISTLRSFLLKDKKYYSIYPKDNLIFNAFNLTPYDNVKVVILGQDPYHSENQAHGLAFSVPDNIKIPPSLFNIYKELQNEFKYPIPTKGNLTSWAKQGVLLLNTTLTVREATPQSHYGKGWEQFTDAVINRLNEHTNKIIFLLWGNNAHQKTKLIDSQRHIILQAPHPSPFSAYRGFFGCKHFSLTNQYLSKNNQIPIDWQI